MSLSDLVIPPWVKPALCAVALAGAFTAGWHIEGLRWSAHEAKALKQAEIAFQKQLAQANKESASYEHAREQNRVDTDHRQAEVRTIYKTVPVRPDCEPPASVRSVLEQAIDAANQPAAEPRR